MAGTIASVRAGPVARVRLSRPEVRNALDQQTIAALTEAFRNLSQERKVRVVVLEGEGKAFCGGADVNYMRASLDWTREQNVADALRLSDMFAAIEACTKPVIAKVHGVALGGGAGLVAACDVAIAAEDALFGFTEAKLGIVPAVISPFVVRKIGRTHARALFATGERFGAERALRIGLVHEIAAAAALEAAVAAKAGEILECGPQAVETAKEIARTVALLSADEARSWTAERIADRRASAEGQEGLRAFLEKRRPNWQ